MMLLQASVVYSCTHTRNSLTTKDSPPGGCGCRVSVKRLLQAHSVTRSTKRAERISSSALVVGSINARSGQLVRKEKEREERKEIEQTHVHRPCMSPKTAHRTLYLPPLFWFPCNSFLLHPHSFHTHTHTPTLFPSHPPCQQHDFPPNWITQQCPWCHSNTRKSHLSTSPKSSLLLRSFSGAASWSNASACADPGTLPCSCSCGGAWP